MIKLTDFDSLLSATIKDRSKIELQRDDLDNLLSGKYRYSFELAKDNCFIYRGEKGKKPEIFLSRSGIRKSENTSNYYTDLMSNKLDCWKEYPRRDSSFICSTNFENAESYSSPNNVYSILIPEGIKIGVCPKDDIWTSFSKFLRHIYVTLHDNNLKCRIIYNDMIFYINDCLTYLFKTDNFNDDYFSKIDSLVLKIDNEIAGNNNIKNIQDLFEKYKSFPHTYYYLKFYFYLMKKNENMSSKEVLEKYFSPEFNNFQLCTISELDKNLFDTNTEIWVDGSKDDILFINHQWLKYLLR